MLEGIIIFALGFVFGKYTNQVIGFFKNLYEKHFGKGGDYKDYDED